MYNSAERLQEAIEHSSEDRDPGHGFEGNRYILLRITDVMYRCLKEDLIYFENCVETGNFILTLCVPTLSLAPPGVLVGRQTSSSGEWRSE